MSLYFENEYQSLFSLEDGVRADELAERVVGAALDYAGCPYEAQVNFLLTDDRSIREMNREYRGIDRSTDVLSFPMVDFPVPGDFSFLETDEGADGDWFDPESGELCLGDIVVSADHVMEQAKQYGHSRIRELAFLVAHSMLHLIGYDHEDPQEAAQMENMQKDILEGLGIRRN